MGSAGPASSSSTRRGFALLVLREGFMSTCHGRRSSRARAGERVRDRLLMALPEAATAGLSCAGLAVSGAE
eukprot:2513427-Alexandrium_andersonii.AAC.1